MNQYLGTQSIVINVTSGSLNLIPAVKQQIKMGVNVYFIVDSSLSSWSRQVEIALNGGVDLEQQSAAGPNRPARYLDLSRYNNDLVRVLRMFRQQWPGIRSPYQIGQSPWIYIDTDKMALSIANAQGYASVAA